MRVLVAVAWPYANGPLHLGHVAGSLLPPDVVARYQRLRGRDVLMVSGSDMHGTPITVAAENAGDDPEAFAAKNHALHVEALKALDIHFDLFTSTATDNHRDVVHEIFRQLLDAGLIEKRTMTAPYDPEARRFLPDRYIEGTCPHCGFSEARGDQCDECGRTLDPQELEDPRSKMSGAAPEYRETDHYFLLLTKLEADLTAWMDQQAAAADWRPTVVNFTRNWLTEGLKDRPITRDLTYGVPIPADVEDAPDKRIYVWFEAVIGYLSAAKEWAARHGDPDAWKRFWIKGHDSAGPDGQRHYYFLGKDNIPFHTIIWPGMILGADRVRDEDDQLLLPYDVPANEFLQMRGAKFSKSRGNAFYVLDLLRTFSPDQVRYYLAVNMPERGDTDWTWEDFVSKVNDELVGTFGNYVNRVLGFVARQWGGLPPASPDAVPADEWAAFEKAFVQPVEEGLEEVAAHLDAVELKKALRRLMAIAATGNKSVDTVAPWTLVKEGDEGRAKAASYLRAHVSAIASMSLAIAPFLPNAAQRIWDQLGEAAPGAGPAPLTTTVHGGDDHWPVRLKELPAEGTLGDVGPVIQKLDPQEVLTMFSDASPDDETDEATEPETPRVSIDDFAKLDLRVGTVLSVEDHPKADRLYVLKVDLGDEERQIVAGLKGLVPPEELDGRRIVIIANLEPAKLRGVESQGMMLAAEDENGNVAPLTPAGDVALGAKVR